MNITPIPAFKDNYIWMLFDKLSAKAWVVDPGESGPAITALTRLDLKLSGVLITHHHQDHSGGIADLLDYAGEIPVLGSHQSPVKYINHRLKDGDKISCLDTSLQVVEIPGHTLDHLAYFDENVLFCGDTLFSAGCGKVFEGTYPQMFHSLQQLKELPDETQIYCGHEYTLGNLKFAQIVDDSNPLIVQRIMEVETILQHGGCTLPSYLSDEKKINPFLRCEDPDIIHAVESHTSKKLNNPAQVFRGLREWKNSLFIS